MPKEQIATGPNSFVGPTKNFLSHAHTYYLYYFSPLQYSLIRRHQPFPFPFPFPYQTAKAPKTKN